MRCHLEIRFLVDSVVVEISCNLSTRLGSGGRPCHSGGTGTCACTGTRMSGGDDSSCVNYHIPVGLNGVLQETMDGVGVVCKEEVPT